MRRYLTLVAIIALLAATAGAACLHLVVRPAVTGVRPADATPTRAIVVTGSPTVYVLPTLTPTAEPAEAILSTPTSARIPPSPTHAPTGTPTPTQAPMEATPRPMVQRG